MSTRDSLQTVNAAYRKQSGNNIGFHMHRLAGFKDGLLTYDGSVYPICGPILIVVNENRRRSIDLTITFDYKQATEAGYQTSNVRGITIKQMTYTAGTTWTSGSITIERSVQSYYEKMFKSAYDDSIYRTSNFYGEYLFSKDNVTIDLIHEVDNITVSHDDADWDMYILGSTGARIAYGFSYNELREQGDNINRAMFASARVCPLCEGKKVYPISSTSFEYDEYGNMVEKYLGTTCPECNGFGYTGYNANDELLNLKAMDVGYSLSYAGTVDRMQRLTWAEKWWFYPTIDALKNFISFFTRISKTSITIIQYGSTDREITWTGDFNSSSAPVDYDDLLYAKESYLDIKIPVTELSASGYDVQFVEDIIRTKLPIGTTFKVSAFSIFTSGGDLENEFSVLNDDYEIGQTYKTSMIYEGRGSMYNWGTSLRGVYDETTWEGTTNTGTSDQIGTIFQYGATIASYMAKGSAFNINDSSDLHTTESTSSASTTTNVYLTGGSSSDDVYNGWYITNSTETRLISDYDGATKMVTCAAFTSPPVDGSDVHVHQSTTYDIIGDNMRATGQAANFFKSITTSKILEFNTTESTSSVSTTTNVYLTDGVSEDDYYNGGYITVGSETRSITDYDGATKMITCTAFTGAPGDGVAIFINMYSNYKDIVTYDNFWAELATTGTVSFVR